MPISEDSRAALALLKEVQQSVRDTEDLKNNAQVRADFISSLDNLDRNCKYFGSHCPWNLVCLFGRHFFTKNCGNGTVEFSSMSGQGL
jgi:hypothetical protein